MVEVQTNELILLSTRILLEDITRLQHCLLCSLANNCQEPLSEQYKAGILRCCSKLASEMKWQKAKAVCLKGDYLVASKWLT